MSPNKILTIAAALLIVAIGAVIVLSLRVNNLRSDLEIRTIDLKKKNKQIELHQDSLRKERLVNANKDSVWSKHIKEQYELLVIERKKVNYYKGKYENEKNTPPPAWTNRELDSLLTIIIR